MSSIAGKLLLRAIRELSNLKPFLQGRVVFSFLNVGPEKCDVTMALYMSGHYLLSGMFLLAVGEMWGFAFS